MPFTDLVKAALDLGVVPTLALLLVYAMYRQNKQLAEDRRQMETKLLGTITQVLEDYQKLLSHQYRQNDGPGARHE
jgi:membrane protein implicated in regulation of membrane protease activity